LEALSHIKYTLIFDELVDGPDLDKLYGNSTDTNKQLLEEIVEEEKLVEKY